MGDEGDGKKKRVVLESLGWLTESSIMPKKHRAIEGVGASSILELKAQLYKSQEDSKKDRLSRDPIHSSSSSVHRAKKKITAHDPYSAKNSGVEARAAKDKLELKAIRDGAASYAALEKKAELYDKLVRGEISDEEDQEKYSVDFFRKGLGQDRQQVQGNEHSAIARQDYDDDDDSAVPDARPAELGRTSASVDRNEHKRFVMEVHQEAKIAREKASDVKMMRQEQAAARREKLKQAYLKKKLEKLKASSKPEQT
ncbi:OLC1v1022155C1 [Oldenlandia corymbosa var. corymbosa]|uniref:OLC1v1022155C1 n=1 Tax=Oldenlandia corymbosa var. corymbosa TaxID=529605 RepID=A0AAV1C0Z1_OLDCO|nr:OLC1v1022155C1 [Oldenlandia corymbosa var. corymbosa]